MILCAAALAAWCFLPEGAPLAVEKRQRTDLVLLLSAALIASLFSGLCIHLAGGTLASGAAALLPAMMVGGVKLLQQLGCSGIVPRAGALVLALLPLVSGLMHGAQPLHILLALAAGLLGLLLSFLRIGKKG